jgi:type I restriction enzyme S subunit
MKATWEMKKLGEICEIIAGQAPPSKYYNDEGKGIPFLTVNSFGNIYPRVERWTTKCLRESKEGDVLFSVAGSLGLVNLGINACITRSIFALRPYKDLILQKFLFYTLKKYGAQIALMGSGTAQKVITINQISEFEIPLPPLPVQQKIVKILDTIQEAIDIQEKIIEKVKELKKSLMAELFKYGGPSFRKGRKLKKTEIGEIPEDWEVVRLGEVAKEIIYGISKKGEKEGKYPILRMNNLEDGKINCKDLQFVSLESSEFEKFKLEKGDILFNRTNSLDLVGKTALFTLDGDFVFASYLLRIRTIKDQLLPEYLNYYFNFEKTQQDLKSLASRGASQVNISASKLSSFPIPLPPLSEQQEIAEILQTIDQKIEIEKRKKELYEELFKTMLNKIMNQEIDVEKIEV